MAANPPSLPAPSRPEPITLDATLTGTLVVDGGRSFALFQPANGIRIVGEGDELGGGIRLSKVRTDRIVVERNGVSQEVLLGTNGWSGARPRNPGAPTAAKAAPPPEPVEVPRIIDAPLPAFGKSRKPRPPEPDDN